MAKKIGTLEMVHIQDIVVGWLLKIPRLLNVIVSSKLGLFSLISFAVSSLVIVGALNTINAFVDETRQDYFRDDIVIEALGDVEKEGGYLVDNTIEYALRSSEFIKLDKREYVLEKYFETRQAPLMGHAHLFVEACDNFGAPKDCISTAAIARHETDLCNYFNSADYHNCMGWGGGGEYRQTFPDFKTHIDRATDVLVNQYGPQYMDDPRLMQWVFCGPQDECIGWGNRILFFMREIDQFSESLGVGRLTDLRDDGLRYENL